MDEENDLVEDIKIIVLVLWGIFGFVATVSSFGLLALLPTFKAVCIIVIVAIVWLAPFIYIWLRNK